MRNQALKHRLACVLILGLILVFVYGTFNRPVSANPASVYTVDWYSIDGGGSMNLTSGAYTLSGTIGQFDASNTTQAGNHGLTGGFWSAWNLPTYSIFLPLIQR